MIFNFNTINKRYFVIHPLIMMEDSPKKYWKGIEELTNDIDFVKNAENEFAEPLPKHEPNTENNRRDFLKLMGFSVAAVSLAACETPVKYAVPYLNKPENLDPSIPNFYASTFFEGGDYSSILVKTREGRPIKIEGNNLSPINKGKTSAKAQASILGLYDDTRYKGFMVNGKAGKMESIDEEVKKSLESASNIRILSSTIISPSTESIIKDFIKKYPTAKHVQYDSPTVSAHGILQANKESFGVEALPSYDFSKAKVIVSFGADFLGTWLSATEYATQYGKTRKLGKDKKEMSRHYQFETRLSLTGANADYRGAIKPSEEALAVVALYNKLNGGETFANKEVDKLLEKAKNDLQSASGNSLVVSGSNDPAVQMVVNAINNQLGNYGNAIDMSTPSYIRKGNDNAVNAVIDEIIGGGVDTVIFYGVNPVYDHPKGKELKSALSNVKNKISFALAPDETSTLCNFVCPDTHFLESWNDAMPKKGIYTLTQPTITPIFKTRSAQESLLLWSEAKTTNFHDFIKGYWNTNVFKTQTKFKGFANFWTSVLHDGQYLTNATIAEVKEEVTETTKEDKKAETKDAKPKVAGKFSGDAGKAVSEIGTKYKTAGFEMQVYQTQAIGNGSQANNPWLQEMPDPITKACWGNYASISQKTAKEKGITAGYVVKVSAKGMSFELPVLIQPGQADNTVVVAVGYGREVVGQAGKINGKAIGVNVFPLAIDVIEGVSIAKTDKYEEVAQTQTHHTIMGRDIIQETTLAEYVKKPNAGRNYPHVSSPDGIKKPSEITLWKGHKYPNHSWSMVIDLNSCIGCSACTVACQAENNVSVVGKAEVLMRREMHWIRIDRYYSSNESAKSWGEMEEASANPEVTFMPLMCQHCNNAPCETVCPVLATTHSTEGLNQMTYNRCIGTRYCANNCPYKVRRFNWFHYAEDDRFTTVNYTQTNDLGKMVLNPDVTVRSRGVMEKCSMCVQRIQAGKLTAKKEKRHVKDGDVITACAQACPTDAITFGDMNDLNSEVAKALSLKKEMKKGEHGAEDEIIYSITEPRAYQLLEEINVKPQISYLTKIRNKDEKKGKGDANANHGGGEHH